MIEAYMDESGIHDGAHVCAIAGYWGSVRKWKRFEERWKKIIADAAEPSMKEFHSTEFWNSEGKRKGVFANWSNAKADKFIDDLTACIVESRIYPASAMLEVDAWNRLNQYERKFLTGAKYDAGTKTWDTHGAPNKTYFLPFQLALITPTANCSPGLHVHYTFDLNKQFKNHALELFSLLKNDKNIISRHRFGNIDFENGENAVGLQAADLFAYQSYKFGKIRAARNTPALAHELPPLLRRLVTNARTDDDFPFLNAEGLNRSLQSLPAELRSPGWKRVQLRLRHHKI